MKGAFPSAEVATEDHVAWGARSTTQRVPIPVSAAHVARQGVRQTAALQGC